MDIVVSLPYTPDIRLEMVMRVKAAKWGNSVGVRLPSQVVREMRLGPGRELDVSITPDRLILTPVAERKRRTLDELIAEAERLGPDFEPPPVDWGPDRGAEILRDD